MPSVSFFYNVTSLIFSPRSIWWCLQINPCYFNSDWPSIHMISLHNFSPRVYLFCSAIIQLLSAHLLNSYLVLYQRQEIRSVAEPPVWIASFSSASHCTSIYVLLLNNIHHCWNTNHCLFFGWQRPHCSGTPWPMSIQVAQLSQRDRAAVWLSCGPNVNIIFCIQRTLLLQLVSPVNRQRLKCHRMQRHRANGWFTSRTKFAFKRMSPTNYFCTDRYGSKCLTTLLLTVFAQINFAADFLRDTERKTRENGDFAFLTSPLWGA